MRALLILNFIWIFSPLESKHPPGHLEPLGSHQPPLGSIEITDFVPSSPDFFEQYALPGEPVLFKGAAKKMPAFSKWTDEYLRYDKKHLMFLSDSLISELMDDKIEKSTDFFWNLFLTSRLKVS